MKVFTTTTFTGHWPVGVAAVIVANDRGHAKRLLLAELSNRKIKQKDIGDIEFELVDTAKAEAHILNDGDY